MMECKQKALIYLVCLVFVSSTVGLPQLAKAADASIDRYGRSQAALRYADFEEETRYFAMIGDLFVARPLLLAATGLGTGIFLISLPFSALGGNVKEAANTLVANPARHTFRRCLGCRFSNLDADRPKREALTSTQEQPLPLTEPYPLKEAN